MEIVLDILATVAILLALPFALLVYGCYIAWLFNRCFRWVRWKGDD